MSRYLNAVAQQFIVYLLLGAGVLAATVAVMQMNTDRAFRAFQSQQLREEAVRFADRLLERRMAAGPLSAEQRAWIDRESALRQLYVRLESAGEEARLWYDGLSASAGPGTDTVRVPLVSGGEAVGLLSVSYRSPYNADGAPEYGFARNTRRGEVWIWSSGIPLVAAAAYLLAVRQSRQVRRMAAAAGRIRRGDRTVVIPAAGLIQELQTVGKTLNELTVQLEKQEGVRAQLTQDLTHEFRTPITTMITELEAVMDGVYPMDEERIREIYTELERLTRLIDDVEQLFDAEGVRFKLDIARHDIVSMLQGICRNFLPVARDKGIEVKFEHPHRPCYAEVDQDRVAQIVINLLTNALKFTEGNGDIILGVEPGEDGKTFAIYCEDHGIGISPDDLPRIFDRFYRANRFGGNREVHGLGVGLSICKALTEAHDGTIQVRSTPGKGSRFTVTLPTINKDD